MKKFSEYTRSVEPELVDVLVAFVVVTSGVMLLQLVLGIFEPISALFFSLLICGVIGLAFVRKVVLPEDTRNIVAIVLMGVLILMPRWSPFLYVEGGQDEGIYVSMSSHFTRTGGLSIKDQVREPLSIAQKIEYDKRNNRYNVAMPNRSEGWHQPGVYIGDLTKSSYVFQFYPLHPLWMGLASRLLGEQNRVYSLVLFSLLNILMLSLLVYELSGRQRIPAYIAAGLLAINPMHVFLSRFPVTENVTLFFSASAIYYLVRYFKGREQNHEKVWHLILSAGAWAGMFFNHIAGFMYAPILLAATLFGVVTAGSAARMRQIVAYGIAVFIAYLLSLWFGMTGSFPYSFDLYPQIIGKNFGVYFVNHWLSISLFVGILSSVPTFFAWVKRDYILSVWSSRNLRPALNTLLLVLILCIILSNLFEAYRLGFTAHYSEDSLLGTRFNLSNAGTRGFLHSTLVALTVYVSPFIAFFVLAMLVKMRRTMSPYETFLILLISVFFVARVGMDDFTLYYYYGRYRSVELLPYILVIAVLWMHTLFTQDGRRYKVILGWILGLTIVWNSVLLAQQYPGGELHRLDASMRPLVEQINDNDLLVFAGGEYPALRTALDYYYGKHTVVVDSTELRENIKQYLKNWADVYVLSDSDSLSDLSYLGAIHLVRDMYMRGIGPDIIPMHPMTENKQYFLYRVNRPEFNLLREGDAIDFSSGGNAGSYLGAGWSNQEKSYRWTEGETASLELPFATSNSDLVLRFEVRSHNCVDVSVRVGGSIRTRWTFADCSEFQERVVVLSRDDMKGGKVTVSFDMLGVVSPHDLNPEIGDTRKLGISVNKIVFEKVIPGKSLEKQISKYSKQLQLGVNFSANDFSAMILSTDGLSAAEPWGRWTDGNVARIRFKNPLPHKFDLVVTGGAYGPNIGKPVKFKVGSQVKEIVFTSDPFEQPHTYHAEFALDTPSDTLEIGVPMPTKPDNGDQRKLGIGLIDLKIIE